MEKYENIMKLVDKTLGENERTIDFYREESGKHSTQTVELMSKIALLEAENKALKENIKNLEEENSKLKTRIDNLTF